jgi:ABC-2 type transport system ATP-binding protein
MPKRFHHEEREGHEECGEYRTPAELQCNFRGCSEQDCYYTPQVGSSASFSEAFVLFVSFVVENPECEIWCSLMRKRYPFQTARSPKTELKMNTDVIEVVGLTKVYRGGILAVDDISFSIHKGEIFGLLGPNGAGKSTTIKVLIGLLNPTKGRLLINGIDIAAHPAEIKRATGYAAQETAIDDRLTCMENIYLQGRFYHLTRQEILDRSAEMLRMFDLYERRDDLTESFSGGMLKRLDIAEALIHRPQILFLDEPTLGLDVQTRKVIWKYIERLRHEQGMTIFLTTHYMDEADQLSDRVAIIDQGKIKALDNPDNLKATIGGDIIITRLISRDGQLQPVLHSIEGLPQVTNIEERRDGAYWIIVRRDGDKVIPEIVSLAERAGISIESISLKKPSLDDVYLHFTGKQIREAEESREAHGRARRMRGRMRR